MQQIAFADTGTRECGERKPGQRYLKGWKMVRLPAALGCPALPTICSTSDCGWRSNNRGELWLFMLSKYECLHLFPVASTMAGNMRDALYPSGAKDDPRDADLLMDLLLQHRDKLRRLSPDTEATRRVQNLVEERRKLVDEKQSRSTD